MSDYNPDTRPTIACPNPKCGHSIVIPPLLGEMGDRHPKWQQIEPGTVIPAGQPYRYEYETDREHRITIVKQGEPEQFQVLSEHPYFIDSSWKPPLALPTEWTWGIVVTSGKHPFRASKWRLSGWLTKINGGSICPEAVQDFIPLTPEQVARIEAAR